MNSRVLRIVFLFVVCGLSLSHSQQDPKQITMTYLCDNYAFKPGTIPAWGFSCFIQGAEKTILFDAGPYGDILLRNALFLGVDLSKTEKIFLSHFHADHYLGLDSVLNHVHQVPIYAPALTADENVVWYFESHGGQLVYVQGPIEICGGMYSSGELLGSRGADVYEHALAMDTDSGLVVVTGCSHPHIEDILAIMKDGLGREIFAVFGGFHLLDLPYSDVMEIIQKFKRLGVHKCGAGHCTGDNAISWFRQAYGNDFIPTGVGQVLSFPARTVPASGKRMWLSPCTITFPDAEVARSADTAVIRVDNITSRDLTVLEVSHKNAAYEFVGLPTLPATVHPGISLFVKMVFRPSAAQKYSDTVRILSDDSMAPVRLITVTGNGLIMAGSERTSGSPLEFSLLQNYPNPFNPSTTIRYKLPRSTIVSLKIFDALGQLIATLVDERKEAGSYQAQWSADVPSGIYFYRLQARQISGQPAVGLAGGQAGDASTGSARGFVETKRMILLR